MSLRTETAVLRRAVERLGGVWADVALTTELDRPVEPPLAVGPGVGAVVDDVIAALTEASALLDRDPSAAGLPPVAELLLRVRRQSSGHLTAYDAWASVLAAVRGQGVGWGAWVGSLASAVAACAEPLDAAEDAMLRCWRELAEARTR